MPELPEVETISRALSQGNEQVEPIIGQIINSAQVLWERTIAIPSARSFKRRIKGQKVLSVGRRGKFIIITLERDTLLIHLRMSGDLRVEAGFDDKGKKLKLKKHDHLVLELEHGLRLVFNDPRKFGRVWLLSNPQEILGKLGPEPLDPDLSAEEFYTRLHSRQRQLKPLLMDQSFLAGLGNIYTDEALYLAKLHPLTISNSLAAQQAANLLQAIRKVLKEGISHNGTSFDWVYRGGEFQDHLRVYGRTGEPCLQCGTPIQRIIVRQRGTHICPQCQRLKVA